MRVLLTGADGFIGRHVANQLTTNGVEFLKVSRKSRALSEEKLSLDLLAKPDWEPVLNSYKPTHLIHLAWCTEHGKYWESKENLAWIDGTYHLLDAFYKSGGEHAFHAGTCAEYDWRYGYCDEELTPCNPTTLYGIAKDATRRMCQALAANYGTQMAWGRIFFPYGPGEGERRLIPSLIRALRHETPLFGVNGNFIRDFISVNDIAEAICMISTQKYEGVINLCSGIPVSLREIVEVLAELCRAESRLILDLKSPKRNEPEILIGSNQKLIKFGWRQRLQLELALKNYIENIDIPKN
jgi:nucleoside-diphosphate-sugar epimerase